MLHWILATSLFVGPASEAVGVWIGGEPERRRATREVLDELLGSLVEVGWNEAEQISPERVVRPEAVDQSRLAHIYVDLDTEDTVVIFVADRTYERILVRRVPLAPEAGYDEVAREQVGAIVSTAVEALLGGATIGISREEAERELGLEPEPEPEPAPVPPPAPPPTPAPALGPVWIAPGVGYGLDVWRGSESVAHGPRLRIEIAQRRPKLVLGAAMVAQGFVPQTVGQIVLPTQVTGVGLRGQVIVRARVHPRIAVAGAIGPGIDLLWTRGAGGEPSWTPIPMIDGELGPSIRLARGLWLDVLASVAVDAVDTRILTNEDVVVLDPWRVRPGARLRLSFDVVALQKKSTPTDRFAFRLGTDNAHVD